MIRSYMRKRRHKKHSYGLLMISVTIVVFVITLSFLMQPHSKNEVIGNQESENKSQQFFNAIQDKVQETSQKYGIFASVIMAQAALESDFGNSQLARQYYNLFGVKGTQVTGVALLTKEFQQGKWIEIYDYFKIYENWEHSIEEHGDLIKHGTSWNSKQYEAVLRAKTYQEAAYGLVSSSYATDPSYAQKLIALIERYQLYRYDHR